MPYDVLEQELKTLPDNYISEIIDFIQYLKLKMRFANYEQHRKQYAFSDTINPPSDLTTMTQEEFNEAIEHSYQDMCAGKGIPMQEVFSSIKRATSL